MPRSDVFGHDMVVSIKPAFVAKIMDGTKTVELRRRFPESLAADTIAFIYSSHPVRAIVGYAHIADVQRRPVSELWDEFGSLAGIEREDFDRYFLGLKHGYAILLAEVRILSKQVEATDLVEKFGFVPPQSFRYIGEEHYPLFQDERIQIPHRHQRRHRAGG